MALPRPSGFELALYAVTAYAHGGQLSLGSGLVLPADADIRLLRHGIGHGVPTRPALDFLTGLIATQPDLDLDAYDPWLEERTPEEVALYRSGDLRRPVEGNMDLLAYYYPFHHHSALELLQLDERQPTWGIYLTTGGIEALAREAFISASTSVEAALQAAARALYAHELFHFLTETAITAGELSAASAGIGIGIGIGRLVAHYRGHQAAHTACCVVEEGLANRHVLRLADTVERTALLPWLASGPNGYRDFARYENTRDERDALRAVLGHAQGVPADDLPTMAELAYDLGSLHVGVADVPLHLEVSPGSAYEAGAWSWPGATTPPSAAP